MDHQATDLDGLVPDLRRRDPVAFRKLYDGLADQLASFAYGMLRDRAAAEDAVQQAFLELVRAVPDLRGNGRSVRSWLYRSVRFTCLDELRRRARHPELAMSDVPEPPPVGSDPVERMLDPDLEQALDSLTPEQRTVVLLRHVVGMSGAEIAKVVGSNRPAVYAMISRAEGSLRRFLEGVESSNPTASQEVTRGRLGGR